MIEYKFEDYHFKVWCQDNGAWCAQIEEIPGIVVMVDTPEEIIPTLKSVFYDCISSFEKRNISIPSPDKELSANAIS